MCNLAPNPDQFLHRILTQNLLWGTCYFTIACQSPGRPQRVALKSTVRQHDFPPRGSRVKIRFRALVLIYLSQGVNATSSESSAKEDESHAEVQNACLASAIASVGLYSTTIQILLSHFKSPP